MPDVTIRQNALLDDKGSDAMKQRISSLIRMGRDYWRPLHRRMDYWASMYYLLDEVQRSKPAGYRRFVSNEPATAVDSAVAIMTRNPAFWRIDMNRLEAENKDERQKIGKLERTLQGIVNDVDEMFSMRGEGPLWKQAAFYALLRGTIWAKFHVTTSALDYRESPIVAEVYDGRMVIPHFDQFGIESVIIVKDETYGAIDSIYPGVFDDIVNRSGKDLDLNRPATKIEFWSNTRGARLGITGTLAVLSPDNAAVYGVSNEYDGFPTMSKGGADARWLIPPHAHGYDPASLPIVGVYANGVPITRKPPLHGAVAGAFAEHRTHFGHNQAMWHGVNTAVAERGRSILANVEETVPQANELVATILQHFGLDTYPTWVFKTPTGELPNFEPNLNARIPLRPEESVERIGASPISPDAFRLMDILQREKEQGTLSSILRASMPLGGASDLGSGILFSQMTNAALNGLDPFDSAMKQFSQRAGTTLLRQLQLASSEIKKFTVSVPYKQNTFFDVEFDPKTDMESGRKYKARAVFQPALPDDMHIRIQMARLALDPRRPVLSLVTVLENILKQEDPQGEVDRMWEDMANQDPLIVLEQIAQALDRFGEEEMAERMRENQFRMKFLQDAQFRQITGSMPGLGGGGGEAPPERLGPESGAPGSTTRNEGSPEQAPSAQEGMNLVGAAGERRGV